MCVRACGRAGRPAVQRVVRVRAQDVRHPLLRSVSVPRLDEHRHRQPFRQAIRHHQPTRRLRPHDLRQGAESLAVTWECEHNQAHRKQFVRQIPSPLIPSPFSSSSLHLHPRCRPFKYSCLGSAVSSPAASGAEPQRKSNLVHFSLKIRESVDHSVCTFSTCVFVHFTFTTVDIM